MAMISSIRMERGRCFIMLDTGEKISIPSALLKERPLSEGEELDIDEYDQWLMVRQYRFALQRAVAYLAQRPCSSKEISDKLLRIGYRPCTVEMVIYKLHKEKLLNDREFAEAWTASRSRNGLGKIRIAMELRKKGIEGNEVQEVLESIDEEEQMKAAVKLAESGLRRGKAGEDPRKALNRVIAMLARRGYEYSVARKAVEAAIRQQSDEE